MRILREDQEVQKGGFRINMEINELAQLLFAAYIETVESRGRCYVDDKTIQEKILEVANVLTTPSYRFGILLSGNCGNGKTTMMYAIRKSIHFIYQYSPNKIANWKTFNTKISILSAKEICNGILYEHNTYMDNDILMIDDLGHESTEFLVYGTVHTPIIDLLEMRYARQKFTIISTNLSNNQIRPKYKNRIADRFNEWFNIIEFPNESFRQ